jgi:hypothetical protein
LFCLAVATGHFPCSTVIFPSDNLHVLLWTLLLCFASIFFVFPLPDYPFLWSASCIPVDCTAMCSPPDLFSFTFSLGWDSYDMLAYYSGCHCLICFASDNFLWFPLRSLFGSAWLLWGDSEGEEGAFVNQTSVLDCYEEILKEKKVPLSTSLQCLIAMRRFWIRWRGLCEWDFSACLLEVIFRDSCIAKCTVGHWRW